MSEWDGEAAGWDDDPYVRAYADAAFASLTALAAREEFDINDATVCDFGCGTGLLTERLVTTVRLCCHAHLTLSQNQEQHCSYKHPSKRSGPDRTCFTNQEPRAPV